MAAVANQQDACDGRPSGACSATSRLGMRGATATSYAEVLELHTPSILELQT